MNMRSSISRTALGVLAALLLSGCAIFRTPPPLTPEASYQVGMAAHEAGRHGRAVEHLSRFVLVAAGDARMRDALMALARSQLATREYISAAATFLRVVTEFPRDAAAVEARYGVCDAYYRLSPRAQLDQQHTHTAITYCQSYAELYPQAPEAETARERVVEMHDKLAHKAYLNGLFYFRRNYLDSSLVYFGQVVETYPGTPWAPAALAMMVQAYERMGLTEDAQATREQLLRDYPQSPEARQPAA